MHDVVKMILPQLETPTTSANRAEGRLFITNSMRIFGMGEAKWHYAHLMERTKLRQYLTEAMLLQLSSPNQHILSGPLKPCRNPNPITGKVRSASLFSFSLARLLLFAASAVGFGFLVHLVNLFLYQIMSLCMCRMADALASEESANQVSF